MDRILKTAGIHPVMDVPQGIEVRKRVDAKNKEVFIVINHERAVQTVQLPWPAYEHLTGLAVGDRIKLGPYGVVLLSQSD